MSEWRKAIPEARDRLQAKVLVWVVGTALVVMAAFRLIGLIVIATGWSAPRRYHAYPHELWYTILPWVVSLTFGLLVWRLRAATFPGVIFGSLICLQVTSGTIRGVVWDSGLTPLIALFVLTFTATRAGRARKVTLGVAEGRKGRSAAQIIANLGAAALAPAVVLMTRPAVWTGMVEADWWSWVLPCVLLLAALCGATADTVSSELGQAFGGTPFLLTSLRAVPIGTDGAVSLLGTAAGVLASGVVALTGMWSMRLDWRVTLIAFTGGVAGLVFDSVLGATVERRGWLGNDLVNFSSTVFAAATALALLLVY